ncbi:MAG: hypothetical protein HFH87_04510 [Lachnospiraceae bacterium]|nr:hypothetical protein [Lachnospiraceae bacterium]
MRIPTIIKCIFFVLWYAWCLYGIIRNYSHYRIYDWLIVILIILLPTIFILVPKKKKRRNKDIAKNNSDISTSIIEEFSVTPQDQYIESDKIIYRTDKKSISDKEIPHLVQAGYEEAIVKWKIPELTRLISDSYNIIYNTDNPETLCARYKFLIEKVNELAIFKQQGLFDADTYKEYEILISDDNFYSLIMSCYQKYTNKAHSELKTQKGINNRINKFWETIHINVSAEFYDSKFRKT